MLYGRNGTGKSTVGAAIKHAFLDTEESLKALESYEFKDTADPASAPSASCATRIRGLHVFADETCHIGGSYLFQLDGDEYVQVPFYVMEWCDEVAAKAAMK